MLAEFKVLAYNSPNRTKKKNSKPSADQKAATEVLISINPPTSSRSDGDNKAPSS